MFQLWKIRPRGKILSGKREGGGDISASLLLQIKGRDEGALAASAGGLPVSEVLVNGIRRHTLVDSGCTRCIAHTSVVDGWKKSDLTLWTIDGGKMACKGVSKVTLGINENGKEISVDVIVVAIKPLGFEFVLGMNGISALGGVRINSNRNVRFQSNEIGASAVTPEQEIVRGKGFEASFDPASKKWNVKWDWLSEPRLKNRVAEYKMKESVRGKYAEEIRDWISKGWLVPYSEEELGEAKGLIPLMAVVQSNKNKVRPCLDFREVNDFVEVFTGEADVCADKLREWRKFGENLCVIDLARAYLQLGVDKSIWPYQTVIFEGQRFCLTRLGFGLNIAPIIMASVLKHVLNKDKTIARGASSFIDDVCV